MLTNVRTPRRQLRQKRVRKKVHGTDIRPRLTVSRSGRHMYAQIISDEGSSRTLAAASTLSSELREKLTGHAGNRDAAREVGSLIARRALDAGLTEVVFDRNGYLYHGRVRVLAEAAREAGLRF